MSIQIQLILCSFNSLAAQARYLLSPPLGLIGSSLRMINCLFRYVLSPYLWNLRLPDVLCQPSQDHSLSYLSHLLDVILTIHHSFTLSRIHIRLKTYLFHKSLRTYTVGTTVTDFGLAVIVFFHLLVFFLNFVFRLHLPSVS